MIHRHYHYHCRGCGVPLPDDDPERRLCDDCGGSRVRARYADTSAYSPAHGTLSHVAAQEHEKHVRALRRPPAENTGD